MKRALLLMLALCLMMSATAVAEEGQGLKNAMFVAGYGGYTIGMGDAFEDYEMPSILGPIKLTFDAGISFGGAFHYGVSPKLLVGVEVGFQAYKAEASLLGVTESETEYKANILPCVLYALNFVEDEQAFFLTFGGGFYGGWEEAGFNAGLMYTKMVSPSVILLISPRFHYVMADPDAVTMVQIIGGVVIPLGGR
jgi:opacity protein-like surface antigen